MIIKDLVKILTKFDGNKEIYLSNDIEGNQFKTIYEVASMGGLEEAAIVIFPTDDIVETCLCGIVPDEDGRCGCTNKDSQ